MNTKHTPGPWRYSFGLSWPIVQRGIDGGFYVTGTTKEKAEADARLIAAAPEMLDALEMLVALLPDPEIDTDEVQKKFVKQARAAIAKATGGQP